MRRGLKHSRRTRTRLRVRPIKEFPDEEGTETCNDTVAFVSSLPIKEFPDEEGTETLIEGVVHFGHSDDQRIPR